MADPEISTETASASTSAAAETVENTNTETPSEKSEASTPLDRSEPWANIDKNVEEPAADPAKVETADEPAKTETERTEKTEKAADKSEKPLEDQVLDEVFETEVESAKPEETKDEDDLDTKDPKEMIAGQRNATARAWAERQEKMAEPVKMLRYPDKKSGEFAPIEEVAQKLEEFNPERFAELSQHTAHKLVDENPESAFRRAYAIKLLAANPATDLATLKIPTLDEVIAGVGGATSAAALPDLTELSVDLDKELGWNWRDETLDHNFVDGREMALAKTLRGMEAAAKAETAEKKALEEQLGQLKQQAEKPAGESEKITALRSKLGETIGSYEKGVKEKLLPYIAKSTGLEVSKDDTPEITAFKESRMQLYTGTEYEQANNINSQFESFAYNESSVKGEFETLITRLVGYQTKEAEALLAKNQADADKYHRLAEDERVPLFTLFAQANKEFKAKYIAPDMALIGNLSGKLADPIKEASERQEIVSNGGSAPASHAKRAEVSTAEGVWDRAVSEAAKEDALRANA